MILSTHGILASSGGVAFDPDYQAILDYATTQGYTLPSAGQQTLQNQLVVDLKAGGIWSKLDTFAVFATNGNSNFALIDWKRLSQYTAVNSPTFSSNGGFTGNGTSSYINTNFNPSTSGVNFTLNGASRYFYLRGNSNSNMFDSSNEDATSNQNSLQNTMRPTSTTRNCRINSGGTLLVSYDYTPTALEMKSLHRTSSTDITAFRNTSGTSITMTSAAIANTNQIILRGGVFYNTAQVSMYAMGSSLVSENTDFVNAFNTYLTSL